ncbi:MAG: RcpC/CpaB family pilus assembly protein [Lachnospiraceae bacterium]|nr:RcpC/CpaB family pilus assembly protein [Lachnospiraceae bacterium]
MSFKKIFQNRIVLWLICAIFSGIMCFVLPALYNNALSETAEVVRMASGVKRGEKITADKLITATVGAYNLPDDAIKDKESVIGSYAAADLYAGDYIFPGKLTQSPVSGNEYLSSLGGSKLAVSITIPYFAAGLSGKLAAGDIATVIAGNAGEDKQTLIPPELRYVEILAVTDENGHDLDNSYLASTQDGQPGSMAATVTFLATAMQARLLADAELNANIHLALAYRGIKETAGAFLAEQDRILAMVEEGEIMPTAIAPLRGGLGTVPYAQMGAGHGTGQDGGGFLDESE